MILQEGDLVQHKAGGPTMCIEGFDTADKYANCSWFIANANQYAQFAICCLKMAPQEEKPEEEEPSRNRQFLFDARPGQHVSQAAASCRNYGCGGFVFNGIIVRVEEGDCINEMVEKYYKQTNKQD